MDYLASEISQENRYLKKIADGIGNMNQPKFRTRQQKREDYLKRAVMYPSQTTLDKKILSNETKIMDIDKIPSNTFECEGLQEIERWEGNTDKWLRYELNPKESNSQSYYLILAYCIIKKELKIDGYSPTEIAIEFNKGRVMENQINIQLNKDNINESSIRKFADIIDLLDLTLTLFVLWADPNSSKQKNKRKQISGTTRQNVLMRDNYTCQICGATVEDGAKLEIDHVVPVSKGGTNDEDNLQVLCQQCNREKHNRTDLLHDKRKLEELQGK